MIELYFNYRYIILFDGGFYMHDGTVELKKNSLPKIRNSSKWRKFKEQKFLQAMVIPWVIWLIIFAYIPMYGIIIAFKEFDVTKGILNSPWVGLMQFKMFFNSPDFWNIMRNTLGISLLKLVFGFPAPIVFALLLNELSSDRYKKTIQSISYLPHFISWVVVAGMLIRILSTEGGLINDLLILLGIIKEPVNFLGEQRYFWGILLISDIWKGVGWGSIIYLAAISNIDQEMYESAIVDGASRLKRIIHITLPSIAPTIVVLLIFSLSGILNANFDQIYLLQNPLILEVSEVIDTYVFKTGISQGRFSYSTAAGLFKSVISVILIIITNILSKKISGHGIW